MLEILSIIFPVFGLAGAGYAAAYWGLLRPADSEGLGRFVFSLAVPVLLFHTLASLELPGEFNWAFIWIYYGVSFAVFGLGLLVSRRAFQNGPAEGAIFGLGASYSNLVLVGLPIVSAAFGEAALLPLFALISVQSLLMFPLVAIVAAPRQDKPTLATFLGRMRREVLGNPIVAGLLLGLLFRTLNLGLPDPLDHTLELLGRAALPTALIVLGASLRQHQLGDKLREAWAVVGLKMLVQPLLVGWLAFVLLPIDPLWAAVAVMAAAMPTGVNTYVLAEQYQAGRQTASAAILLSTLLAIASQSVLLAWLA